MNKQIKWLIGPITAVVLAGGAVISEGHEGRVEPGLFAAGLDSAVVPLLQDLDGHWAKEAVKLALAKGYVDGYDDGTFQPDRQVSRAEFAKLAVSAVKATVPSGSSSGSDWYVPYANAAVTAGFHKWSDFTSGDWNTPMSRAEMARMAVRAAGQDTEDDRQWMYLATKTGLIQGTDDTGSLEEEGTTTRAQAVTIIERILAIKEGRGDEIAAKADQHAINRAELMWHKTNIFTVMPTFFGGRQIEPWDESKLVMETPDGLYKGAVDKIVAIDFGDPNDPHRNILGDVNELTWTPGGGKYFNVTNYPDAYGVVAFLSTEYTKDKSIYPNSWGGPSFIITGFRDGNGPVVMSQTGILDEYAKIAIPQGYTALGFIYPKHGIKTDGRLSIKIEAPALPPYSNYAQYPLKVVVPKVIE